MDVAEPFITLVHAPHTGPDVVLIHTIFHGCEYHTSNSIKLEFVKSPIDDAFKRKGHSPFSWS